MTSGVRAFARQNGRAVVLVVTVLLAGGPASAEKTDVLRIGYQKSSTLLLARLDGQFEEAFKARGVTVEWREFSSGPPLLQAIASGALDVGEVGDAPGVFAQAADAPLKYLAYADASPGSVGIVVKADSPIKTLADLAGKKIGVAEGSSAHYLLVKALKRAAINYRDIKPVLLQPPDARVGFESGAIDAWAIWDPFLAAAELQGKGRVVSDGTGLVPYYGFYLASDRFLAAAPELTGPFLAELERLSARAKKDVDKTAATIAVQLGISPVVARLYEGRKQRYGAKPLTAAVIASQQALADEFFALGLIKRSIVVRDYVWTGGPSRQAAGENVAKGTTQTP